MYNFACFSLNYRICSESIWFKENLPQIWGSGTNWDAKKKRKHQHIQQIKCMLKKKEEKKRIKCADVTRSKANESEKLVSKLSARKRPLG